MSSNQFLNGGGLEDFLRGRQQLSTQTTTTTNNGGQSSTSSNSFDAPTPNLQSACALHTAINNNPSNHHHHNHLSNNGFPSSSSSSSCAAASSPSFSRLVTFFVDSVSSISNFDSCKTIQLLLEVETRFNEIREEISIRILDPNDPFFIYLYLIDFNEFKKIKQTQKLLVSFEKFAPKLIDMFEKCHDATGKTKLSQYSESGSSYVLCLRNLSRAVLTLDIVEMNEFKNLTHLSFDIPSASEEFVRNNYCSIYRKLKQETEQLRQQIETLDQQLSSLTISKARDLQNLRMEFAREKQFLEEKLKNIEQKYLEDKTKWNETERCLKATIQKLQFELCNKNELLEKERQDHERQYQEWKDKLNQEMSKRYNLVKEVEEKNQLLASENELLRIENDQNIQIKVKNEEELNSIRKDLTKANEIIRKLQNEVKSFQEKMKILNDVAQKQEEIVGIKESTIERLSLDLKLCLQQLKNKEKDIERSNKEMVSQKSLCSQLELQLSTSKQIIANLNKDLEQLKLENETIENRVRIRNLRISENHNGDDEDDNDDDQNERNKEPKPKNCAKIRSSSASNRVTNQQQQQRRAERVVEFEDKDDDDFPHTTTGTSRKNYLFNNVSNELPLKAVNLRTTNANRNQTNVMSSSFNPKRRSLV